MLELRVLTEEHIKRHENIATLLGVSWHPSGESISPILVMELACEEHSTLKEFLRLKSTLQLRLELLRDVLEGLSALHNMEVIHGDIKPENVLLFRSNCAAGLNARLSDFGFCRPNADYKYEAGGTPYWNAPECLPGAPDELRVEAFSKGRDIYSLGLLACHLITSKLPFENDNIADIIARKLQGKVTAEIAAKIGAETCNRSNERWVSNLDVLKDFANTVSTMVSLQPSQRPSIDAIRTLLR
jgi:serine/threonine protein kinase